MPFYPNCESENETIILVITSMMAIMRMLARMVMMIKHGKDIKTTTLWLDMPFDMYIVLIRYILQCVYKYRMQLNAV